MSPDILTGDVRVIHRESIRPACEPQKTPPTSPISRTSETLDAAKDKRRRAAGNSPAPGSKRLAKDETT